MGRESQQQVERSGELTVVQDVIAGKSAPNGSESHNNNADKPAEKSEDAHDKPHQDTSQDVSETAGTTA